MAKNVIVVDEQGNEYGATYPKRAKGLVKNGRARFIDENKICLACPPKEFLEDNMNENINTANETNENKNASLYTMDYCLSQIEKIQSETAYINEVLAELSKVSECNNEFVAQERMKALVDAVRCRETTNQKLLDFYVKMYEDLRESTETVLMETQKSLLHISDKIAETCDEDDTFSALKEIAEMITDLTQQAIKN
ncbi:MAG: hypothetical protein E7595_04535 [Ruminococcaceae bacterium]|nr:hypothetical protein [Oscillospiraceae bacterium]